MLVLTGLAGSGKTELLRRLSALGEQTIDLERLASHRGSAFGAAGEGAQPSHEAFGLAVESAWLASDPRRVLWVEDEGHFIGSVGLPPALQLALAEAPCVELEVPLERRRARLVAEYGDVPLEDLLIALNRSARRVGSPRVEIARAALRRGRVDEAVVPLLEYFDAAYAERARRMRRRVLARLDPVDDVSGLLLAIGALVGTPAR
ncbi:MAG: hypothetical protein IPO09_12530 [Anaeromyxobacter sp.]|nr:hypothetical protein [Anaeromyxobacter sp.]